MAEVAGRWWLCGNPACGACYPPGPWVYATSLHGTERVILHPDMTDSSLAAWQRAAGRSRP
jgi:hypothetical protein